MHKLKLFLCLFLFITGVMFGQLQLRVLPNSASEAPILKNEKGELYSTLFTFKYGSRISNVAKGVKQLSENDITSDVVKESFKELKKKYGKFTILKAIPDAVWGDTVKINRRTKKPVRVHDFSQLYQIKFENNAPIDSVTNYLNSIQGVEYSNGPLVAIKTISPNDPEYYQGDYKWSFDVIQAENAWGITTGSTNIKIGIHDLFYGVDTLHQDIVGKVDWDTLGYSDPILKYGGHGIIVAGAAAASTNNNSGIASIGWNTHLMLADWGFPHLAALIRHGADIINFSWVNPDYNPTLSNLIHDALNQGIVCIAAAGNGQTGVQYPAAYNYGSDGQVIAVSATELNNGTEQFIPGFTYSPGTDPINDPTNSFIDLAAPGSNYRACSEFDSYSYQHIWCGTPISAPFVSGLVGLMLAVDNTLTPNQVYDILKKTTDKVGQYTYNGIGWNQYMGYGRINAWDAVNVANGAPTRVAGLVSNGISQDHLVLSWTQNSSPNVSSYKIYRSLNGGDWVYVSTVSYPTTTYTDTNISLSQIEFTSDLKYYVVAVNSSNKTSIPCNSVVYTPPSAPGNLTRTYQDLNHPGMTWDLVTGQNIVGYEVYRNYDGQGWLLRAELGSTVNLWVDNTVIYTKPVWEFPIYY